MTRFYVRVVPYDSGRTAFVVLFRHWWQRFYQSGIHVQTLNLTHDDAENQVAEARAKAHSLARSLSDLDGRA